MKSVRRWSAALSLAVLAAGSAMADEVRYEDVGGIRYQVTRRTVDRQVPVTEMRDQQQTIYRQQVTTDMVQHQQLYAVPVTQYQVVTRLHGRWNPFITPYYTHHYEPVTTWTQQAATVQIPVSRVAWAPETRTVQTPTTTYRTAQDQVEYRVAIGPTPTSPNGQMIASSTGPTATLAARPAATVAAAPQQRYGGQALANDPPKQATGWQPVDSSKYR